ncbi:MAG: hypothetical protein ACQEV0_09890 [Bacillota bacterium]
MFEYQTWIPLIVITIVFNIVMALVYRKKRKVDKDFRFNYYKLSYRRRLKRLVIGAPLVLVAIMALYFFSVISLDVFITFLSFVLLGLAIEITYNYWMWAKREKEY